MRKYIAVSVVIALVLAAVPTWLMNGDRAQISSAANARLEVESLQFRRPTLTPSEGGLTRENLDQQPSIRLLLDEIKALKTRLRRRGPRPASFSESESIQSRLSAMESEAAWYLRNLEDRVEEVLSGASEMAQTAVRASEARHLDQAAAKPFDTEDMMTSMVWPIVQLSGGGSVGSGVVIASLKDGDKWRPYLLTSFHVVRNILSGSAADSHARIGITVYTPEGEDKQQASLIEFDEELDLALLHLPSREKPLPRVEFAKRTDEDGTKVFTPVYTVGCPLGSDPIPTRGEVLRKDHELAGQTYWMISSPAYFGNSGGGVYLEGSREMIGIFSKIYTYGRSNPVVIPHMGLITPVSVVRRWLTKAGFEYLIDDSIEKPATPAKVAAKKD